MSVSSAPRETVISAENDEYQVIKALKENRSKRAKLGELFIEGTESIKQADAAGTGFTRILHSDGHELSDWARELMARRSAPRGLNDTQGPDATNENGARILSLEAGLYRGLCDRENPSELLVTARMPEHRLEDADAGRSDPLVVIFDRPSDLGNFGSLVRSANSFGVDAIFIVGHGIDPWDPKVIRSSLGSVFHSRIVQVESMESLKKWIDARKAGGGLMVVGTDSGGETPLTERALRRPAALVIGNEAKGMSVALRELCDFIARIPLSGAADSLNVSCAASIFLWEFRRNENN